LQRFCDDIDAVWYNYNFFVHMEKALQSAKPTLLVLVSVPLSDSDHTFAFLKRRSLACAIFVPHATPQ
jgi:hypothetical protein